MPEPLNPKKRALMPSTKLRKALRAAGHHLAPVVQVGKDGVSEAVLRQLDEQLFAHELLKVKVGTESPEDRFQAAERLGEGAGAKIAQILGRTVLVYRKHPDRPRFEAKDPAPASRAAPTPKPKAKAKTTRVRRAPARGRPPASTARRGPGPGPKRTRAPAPRRGR